MNAAPAPQHARPRGARSATKGDRRYRQLMDSAARLFHEKGYSSTSLQDLADAVGLQKGSLYHYIDSKEDLLFAILEDTHAFFLDLVATADEHAGTAAQRLGELLYRHARYATEHSDVVAVYYRERSALSRALQERIVATRDAYENALRRIVAEGQAGGEFHPSPDPKLAVFGLLGTINWTNQWYRPEGERSPEEIARELSRMAVRSLLP